MSRRWSMLAAIALSAAMVFGSPTTQAATAPKPVHLWGFQIATQPDMSTYLHLLVQSGSRTIRSDISWAAVQPTPTTFDWSTADAYIKSAAIAHQRPLLLLDQSPLWANGQSSGTRNATWYPPNDPTLFGTFVRQVLHRYGASGTYWKANPGIPQVAPAGIEVWNESNLLVGAPGGANPVQYTALLKAAYLGARSMDRTIPIIAGSFGPKGGYNDGDCNHSADNGVQGGEMNQINFLQQMYAAGAKPYFTAISTHPYRFFNGATADQMLAYHPCSTWSQIRETKPSLRSMMVAHGDGAKKIWISEAGAPTCQPNQLYGAYVCVSEAEQANLATKQLALWASYPWAGGYYWFTLRDNSTSPIDGIANLNTYFGAVHINNSLKPSYATLQAAYKH